ncbi:LiaI-LiaF-like domain-containing protein [Roseivirga seohaensis]|uniref:LiaI-LiaF-like domain-containing protein n=1 Tax=Roseivirga seohaensis TaxID=1914963 RepID=UPI003BAB9C77
MNNLNRNAIVGLIFILIGTVFLLDNLDIISWHYRRYIFQWENILIIVGAILILNKENAKTGGILMGIGVLLNLDEWFNLDVSIFDLWPLVFVVAGIAIVNRNKETKDDRYDPNTGNLDANKINDTAIFGGGDKVINSSSFKGGSLTAIFGGSTIDLTQAKLADGRNEIDVFYMFGGSKIRVPQDWNVQVSVTGIFGGMSDKRKLIDPQADGNKELLIRGTAIFGGAEVTN